MDHDEARQVRGLPVHLEKSNKRERRVRVSCGAKKSRAGKNYEKEKEEHVGDGVTDTTQGKMSAEDAKKNAESLINKE